MNTALTPCRTILKNLKNNKMENLNLTTEELQLIERNREAALKVAKKQEETKLRNFEYDHRRAVMAYNREAREILELQNACIDFIKKDLKNCPYITYVEKDSKHTPSEWFLDRYNDLKKAGRTPEEFKEMNYKSFTFLFNSTLLGYKDFTMYKQVKSGKLRLRLPYRVTDSYRFFIAKTAFKKIEEAISTQKNTNERDAEYKIYGEELVNQFKAMKNVKMAEHTSSSETWGTKHRILLRFKSGSTVSVNFNPYAKTFDIDERRTYDAIRDNESTLEKLAYFNNQKPKKNE